MVHFFHIHVHALSPKLDNGYFILGGSIVWWFCVQPPMSSVYLLASLSKMPVCHSLNILRKKALNKVLVKYDEGGL